MAMNFKSRGWAWLISLGLGLSASLQATPLPAVDDDLMWRYAAFDENLLAQFGLKEAPLLFKDRQDPHRYWLPVSRLKVLDQTKLTSAPGTWRVVFRAEHDTKLESLLRKIDPKARLSQLEPQQFVALGKGLAPVKAGPQPGTFAWEWSPPEEVIARSQDRSGRAQLHTMMNYELSLCERRTGQCRTQALGLPLTLEWTVKAKQADRQVSGR